MNTETPSVWPGPVRPAVIVASARTIQPRSVHGRRKDGGSVAREEVTGRRSRPGAAVPTVSGRRRPGAERRQAWGPGPIRWPAWQPQRDRGQGSARTPGSSRRCTSSSCTTPSRWVRPWQEFFADYHSRAPSVAAAAAASPRVRAIAVGYGSGGPRGRSRPRRRPRPCPRRSSPIRHRPRRPPPAPAAAPGRGARQADPRRRRGDRRATWRRSLEVPTATSFRNVPAKLLEVNRKVINGFRARDRARARSASPT